MKQNKIRIGIIGAGGMTAYHIPGFRKAGAEIVAVADPNAAAAAKCTKTYGIAQTFASGEALLAAGVTDAVSVIVLRSVIGWHMLYEGMWKRALPFVFNNGADAACMGMFDFQVVEDVNVANDYFRNGLPKRARKWN